MKDIKKDLTNMMLKAMTQLESHKLFLEGYEYRDLEYLEKFIQTGYDMLGTLVGTRSDKETLIMTVPCYKYVGQSLDLINVDSLQVENKAYEYTR